MAEGLEVLAKEMKELRDRKKALEEETKKNNAEIKVLSDRMIPIFDDRGIQKVQFEGLGTFYIQGSSFPTIENQDDFFKWLKDNGHQDLIKPTVHPMTLRGFVKSIVEDGKSLPPGVLPGLAKRDIRIRAS